MGKSKRSGSGFSSAKPTPPTKRQPEPKILSQTTEEQKAIILLNQGKLIEAEAIYRQLLLKHKPTPDILCNLSVICGQTNRWEEVSELCRKALDINPEFAPAHNNLAAAQSTLGDTDAAIASLRACIRADNQYLSAYNSLGNLLAQKKEADEALQLLTKALDMNPKNSETLRNIGKCLRIKGDLEKAITKINQSLEIEPNNPWTLQEAGITYHEDGNLTAAIDNYRRYLNHKPNDAGFHRNLGIALVEQGDVKEAIKHFERAIKLEPEEPEHVYNSSMAYLYQEDSYFTGLQRYKFRARRKIDPILPDARPNCTEWSGEELRDDETLLVVSEQGFGDALQFMRYVKHLRSEMNANISICAPPKLHGLIRESGLDENPLTLDQGNEFKAGKWISMMCLIRILGVNPSHPIEQGQYIKTSSDSLSSWTKRLANEKKPIIGINWQGNPNHEISVNKGRSIPLQAFAPIAARTKATLLSLQKGFGSEQFEACSFKDRFVSCQDQVNDTWDFLETAAIIANCDLVITSDTSVAHLAGGMGKTTWLLLKKVPEWRWGLEGDTTFWYPSMRLFRQRERGNWDEVMERVTDALQERFGADSTPAESAKAPTRTPMTQPNQDILAPISLGELIDKITILQIKTQYLQDSALKNVKKELDALEITLNNLQLNIEPTLIQRLKEVNQVLWQIEDEIRDQERQKNFGEIFIRLARSVYQQNDRRAAIKKEINTTYRSAFVEEKSYKQY